MKYVSFLFALALIGWAGLANASERLSINFNYSSNESYYSCSYVQGQASKILSTLGAENIVTQCQGGIQNDLQPLPISMQATYTHHVKSGKKVVLKGHDACEMNIKLIGTILSTIDHDIIDWDAACWGSQGSYKIKLELE